MVVAKFNDKMIDKIHGIIIYSARVIVTWGEGLVSAIKFNKLFILNIFFVFFNFGLHKIGPGS